MVKLFSVINNVGSNVVIAIQNKKNDFSELLLFIIAYIFTRFWPLLMTVIYDQILFQTIIPKLAMLTLSVHYAPLNGN